MVVTENIDGKLVFRSPLYNRIYNKSPVYSVGDTIASHSVDYTAEVVALRADLLYSAYITQARAGIYVLSTEDEARKYTYTLVGDRYAAGELGFVILECEVDPSDFLYHDYDNSMATYKKARFTKTIGTHRVSI
jgi:hypothetical protein